MSSHSHHAGGSCHDLAHVVAPLGALLGERLLERRAAAAAGARLREGLALLGLVDGRGLALLVPVEGDVGCAVWGLGRDPFVLRSSYGWLGKTFGAPSGRGTPSKAAGEPGGRKTS